MKPIREDKKAEEYVKMGYWEKTILPVQEYVLNIVLIFARKVYSRKVSLDKLLSIN
jgi:hypothetical protein